MVSIIVPNYNHAAYLKRRIDSILDQTFQDFELILLDDCSTDNSREVMETYRNHEKVSGIVFNQANSGSTFVQWDKGIHLAKGDFIWIAESDDYCEKIFLEEMMRPLTGDATIGVAFCQALFVSPEGKIVNKTEGDALFKTVPGETFLRRYLLGTNPIPNVSMAVFRKDLLKTASSEYKKLKYCGDWLMYANLSLKTNVFMSGKYLNYYLRHENTVTSESTKKGLDFLEGDLIFHFIKSHVDLNADDIKKALTIKINNYTSLETQFSPEVKSVVLKSLLALDPSMRTLMKKRDLEQSIRKFLSGIKKAFI